MRRLLSKDPESGISQFYVSDPMEGKFRLETVQNVTPFLEAAKASYNSIDERARWGDIAKVATIPQSLFQYLKRMGIADDEKKMKLWLNSRENMFWRTRPGRV